jgi:hypothetical protein
MKYLVSTLFLALVLIGCSDNDDGIQTPSLSNLKLDLSGLEDLGPDYVYEGWIIVNEAPITTGTFTVDGSNNLSETSFMVDAEMLESATAFVLSIEPTVDPDPLPSQTKILSGSFEENRAVIGINDQVGDFSNASGTFFLRSPTDESDGMNNGNDEYGIWFGTPGMPPTPNFSLPTLPNGWIYEGWVVVEGFGPITTGQFTDASAQTADNLAPFSGPNSGPPIPGEDFFENAPNGLDFPLDIRGRTVVVSVEPFPDNSPSPFLLKPLVGMAGQETAPATHNLGLNAASFPNGTVTR